MIDLRAELAGAHPNVILNGGVYELHGSINVDGRSISGNGAVVRWTPDNTRNSPAFILKGNRPRISGITIIGPAPDGAPYDPAKEGQHAFRIDGAANAQLSRCSVRNIHGDGIYIGTVGQDAHAAWTTQLLVTAMNFDELGRHAITANALDGGLISDLNVGRVNLAVFDIEPPGHPWGCKNLRWSNSDIFDSGGGFILSSKGVGTSDSVHDIVLDGIRCHRRLFNVQINPPAGTRRQRFAIRDCVGAGVANNPPLNFRHVDGVTITNVAQPLGRGVSLLFQADCTEVVAA